MFFSGRNRKRYNSYKYLINIFIELKFESLYFVVCEFYNLKKKYFYSLS